MHLVKQQINGFKQKIKALQQQNRNLREKVGSLEKLIEELQEKALITKDVSSVLKVCICTFCLTYF